MQPEPPASKALWSAVAAALNVGGKLFASVVAVRLLGPSEGGRLVLLLWISEVLVTAAGLGLPQAVTRCVATGQPAVARWALSPFVFSLAVATALAGCWQGPEFAFALSAQALAAFFLGWLAGRQEFRAAAAMNAITGFLLAVGVPLLAARSGVRGALVAYGAASLIPALNTVALFRRASAPVAAPVWPYALATWAAAVLSMIAWSRSELWVLERFNGTEAVAMFGAGLTLASVATQAPLLFCSYLLPHFADLHGRAESELLRSAYADATRLLALVVMPATALLSALCPIVLPLLYGPEFTAAVPAASVVIAGASLAFANVGSAYVYGTGKSSFIAFSAIVGALAAAAALWAAVPHWGIWGAAWARIGVQASMVALGCWYIHARLDTRVPVRELLLTGACAAGAGLFAAAVVQHAPSASGALIAAGLFGIVYTAGISFTGLLGVRCAALGFSENA